MAGGIDRRSFLKTGAAAAASFTIVNSGVLAQGNSPNDKLNIAIIGVRGRGGDNLNAVKSENIVALCDVNGKHLAAAAKQFPQAKTYTDWRKCLDQKDIDAVVCSTTDHTHAFINVWALNRGKHVYCEKPLANSVEEARVVREAYLKHNGKVATQMGTQIHASDNYRRMVELIRRGAIGTVKKAHVWCSRTPQGGSYLPPAGDPPADLDWDLWIGPSPMHPYNPGYFGGCLAWNRFWDFGSGQIGDMGSHMMDMAWWALDLRFPTSCEAKGSEQNPDTCPTWLTATWEHPANDWRGPVEVNWYDGGKKPGVPSEVFNRDAMFKGVIFQGDKGWLIADYDYRIVMLRGDMTHYDSPKPEELIPPSPGHHQEWIIGCKTGKPTLCNFDYSGTLIEHNLLALVAYRTGTKLQWDAANLRAPNCPEADRYIRKTYRAGWTPNG
ncbi:MAG TPA: Gfo/Idh/MocA family oxidoreductase [Anaerohalosphaeraceae bacterium]|jgi:predicted dehydrogenase|nr:Gfo/Idh/MocA family oxidoreductase [Anaerohalosphaeraceae bacterium]HRT51069.1 Gfo/Idh/MocA family oxidoreductase [Anaerohalosphaeraceae bacterium]HRT87084.1 Gfo/Idh/MocA family oxidoreductase [Anaerohalosphaeraceae bacterium]